MQFGRPSSLPDLIRFESLHSPLGRVIHAAQWTNSAGPGYMRTMDRYCVTLTIDGSAFYQSPVSGDHTLHAGDLVLVFPGVPHFYGPSPGTHWSEFFVDFDGPVFDLWTKTGVLDPARPIYHVEPVEYWLRQLRSIVESPLRAGPELVAVRVCQLQQFLADAIAYHKEKQSGAESVAWVQQAKKLLESNASASRRDLLQIADEFLMSYETFRKKFTRLVGISPGAYRIHRAIDRAAKILIEKPDVPLKQVAAECGFCNAFYFSKQFKQVVRLSPSDFRRRVYGKDAGRDTGN